MIDGVLGTGWHSGGEDSGGGIRSSGSYATIAQLKLALRTPTSPSARSWDDGEFDNQLTRVLDTASKLIDDCCGWSFLAPAPAMIAEKRTVERSRHWRGECIFTDPISSETDVIVTADGVEIDEDDWYWQHPGSATDAWRHISFYRPMRGPITVEAVWGWPQGPPQAIVDACLLWASHIFKLESNPLGAEVFDVGVIQMSHKPRGVDQLLAPYMQLGAVVA